MSWARINSNTNFRKREFNMSDWRKNLVSQSFVWLQKRDDAAENDNIKKKEKKGTKAQNRLP